MARGGETVSHEPHKLGLRVQLPPALPHCDVSEALKERARTAVTLDERIELANQIKSELAMRLEEERLP